MISRDRGCVRAYNYLAELLATLAVLLFMLAVAPRAANAQVTFYDLFYSSYYTQTSPEIPAEADSHFFAARIFYSNPDDLVSASLLIPGASDPQPVVPTGFNFSIYSDGPFASREEMVSAYPTGTYTYSIDGGTLGAQSAEISRDAEYWPPAAPAFVDGSFEALSNLDASADNTLSINSFDIVDPGNLAITFFTINDLDTFEFVYGTSFFQPASSLTIPQGTLLPDRNYLFSLYHSSRREFANAGFEVGTEIAAFDTVMDAVAHTRSTFCAADFNNDGGVDGADIDTFFEAFSQGLAIADVNDDGGVDGADVDAFFAVWTQGGC